MRSVRWRKIIRSYAVVLLAVGATLAPAQVKQYVHPHALERNGVLAGIAWDLTGGQQVLNDIQGKPSPGFVPFDGLFSLYGNDAVFEWLQDAIQGKAVGNTYAMYGIMKAMRVINTTDAYPKAVEFPACDASSKDAGGMRVVWTSNQDTTPPLVMDASKAVVDAARKQKMWLSSNFRLSVGNLPCSRCSKTDPLLVKVVYATDPAGNVGSDSIAGDFACYVPVADAGPFQEALRMTALGQPTDYPMELDYLDGDGNMIMDLTCTVQVWGVAPADIFADPNSSTATMKVTYRHTGHITLFR